MRFSSFKYIFCPRLCSKSSSPVDAPAFRLRLDSCVILAFLQISFDRSEQKTFFFVVRDEEHRTPRSPEMKIIREEREVPPRRVWKKFLGRFTQIKLNRKHEIKQILRRFSAHFCGEVEKGRASAVCGFLLRRPRGLKGEKVDSLVEVI
jgi:hypothetical protein